MCHMCKEVKSCGFCNLCCHWFCGGCNLKMFARSIEAVKELLKGPVEGCCGVVKNKNMEHNCPPGCVLCMNEERPEAVEPEDFSGSSNEDR